MQSLYRPAVVQAWKQSRSRHSLPAWVDIVGRNLEQFQNEEDIYAPIPLTIKIAGSVAESKGSVIMYAATTDKEWYPKLVADIEQMTGKRGLAIQNYIGEDIASFEPADLFSAGQLNVVSAKSGKLIRLEEPVPPPLGSSPDKPEILSKWWQGCRHELTKAVASKLQPLSKPQIAGAVKAGGDVQTMISNYLRSHTPNGQSWKSFVHTYGTDNVAKTVDPQENLDFLSQGLLYQIRKSLKCNENIVDDFHNNSDIGNEAQLWESAGKKRVLTTVGDAYTMYHNIVEDAMNLRDVELNVISTVLNGWMRVDPMTHLAKKRAESRKSIERPKSDWHPLGTYYKQVHYQTHGQLPGHVMDRFTKAKSVTDAKEYKGDANVAMRIYHMLCGRCPTMSETAKIPPVPDLLPLAEAIPQKKKMPELVSLETELFDLDSVDAEMPELVPLRTEPVSLNKKLPNLVPLETELPDLVPLETELPEFFSLGAKLPELVPLHHNDDDFDLPEMIPISMELPPLVPINTGYGDVLGQPIWNSVDDAPSFEDFLK